MAQRLSYKDWVFLSTVCGITWLHSKCQCTMNKTYGVNLLLLFFVRGSFYWNLLSLRYFVLLGVCYHDGDIFKDGQNLFDGCNSWYGHIA